MWMWACVYACQSSVCVCVEWCVCMSACVCGCGDVRVLCGCVCGIIERQAVRETYFTAHLLYFSPLLATFWLFPPSKTIPYSSTSNSALRPSGRLEVEADQQDIKPYHLL